MSLFPKNVGTLQKTMVQGAKSKLWKRSLLLHELNQSLKLHLHNDAVVFSNSIKELPNSIDINIMCSHSTQITHYQMQLSQLQSLIEQDLAAKNFEYSIKINLRLS